MITRKGSLTVVLTFCLTATLLTIAMWPGSTRADGTTPTIYVSPQTSSVGLTLNFTLDVKIRNVYQMTEYEVHLDWNPAVLNLTKIVKGAFLSNNSQIPTNFYKTPNYVTGTLACIEAQVPAQMQNGVGTGTGNATLFTLTFTAVGTGQCTLHLHDTYVIFVTSNLANVAEDGYFNNQQAQLTLISPQNETYYSSSIPVSLTLTEPASWIGYSLDNQQNTTITGNTIINVGDGAHKIIIYANGTSGNMVSSQIIYFTVASSRYDPWKSSFIGLDSYPIVDFAVYNVSLYSAADNKLYTYDGSSWNIINAPTYVTSVEPYGGKLVVGGKGGLYCYDGTSFSLVFSVPTYIKVLGGYNNTLYAGTMLDNPPKLYYCNGSDDNPDDWHVNADFSTTLNFSGAFGSIDSFAVYDGKMYVASGNTVYCFDGTSWSVAFSYEYAYAFLDMQVYDGKLYFATKDLNRIPLYVGGTGFSGVIMEFDDENWTTVLGHDYWIYSLEVYDGKLYAGTANRIYTFNGTVWDSSFYSADGAYHAMSMIAYNGKIYAGMGNGYIFADPAPLKTNPETVTVPEFPSTAILAVFMAITMLAAALTRKNRTKRFD